MLLRRSGPPKGVEPIPRTSRLTSPSQVPIERLRLTVLRRLNGLLAGDHAGLFPGHGTERGESRPYVPGDDPRHIDWAVTARTHDTHVRDMVADHELDVWLILDSSSSLGFGTGRATKHEVAWSAAGAFALLASNSGNRVGAARTTNRKERSRPAPDPRSWRCGACRGCPQCSTGGAGGRADRRSRSFDRDGRPGRSPPGHGSGHLRFPGLSRLGAPVAGHVPSARADRRRGGGSPRARPAGCGTDRRGRPGDGQAPTDRHRSEWRSRALRDPGRAASGRCGEPSQVVRRRSPCPANGSGLGPRLRALRLGS